MAFKLGDIVDFFVGGSDEETNTTTVTGSEKNQTGNINETTDTTSNRNETTQVGTVGTTHRVDTEQQNNTTRTLSDAQIAAAETILGRISGDFSTADLDGVRQRIEGRNDQTSSAADFLFARAAGAESTLNNNVASIVQAARKSATDAADERVNRFASGAGSQFNSIVTDVFSRGRNDLEVELGGLAGTLAIENRKTATAELLGAVDALTKTSSTIAQTESGLGLIEAQEDSTRSTGVSNLLNAIKGGLTTSELTRTLTSNQRTETQQTTNSVINEVVTSVNNKDIDINETALVIGDETSVTDDSTSLLDLINSIDDLGD